MMHRETSETVTLRDLPSPIDEQFRMQRLSVYNWGTFSKIHTVQFAVDGILLMGPSGAGKSTLLDAISAMIVPPKKVHFNAAAEEGERRGPDRTLSSYVRGAWADRGDADSRDVTKQYLRPGAAISAIALEYGNSLGRTITLVRIFWITGVSSTANINMHFLVVDGSFELTELTDFDGELRKLRRRLDRPGIRQHDTFASYQEHWCRVMGIEDDSALELLHRTQSTKSLGDLNKFLRDFMLAEPETFEKADRLVEEFGELDEAHRAVVAARRQIETLVPARDAYSKHEQISATIQANQELLGVVPAFEQFLKVDLIEQNMHYLRTQLQTAEGERDMVVGKIHGSQDEIAALERQHLEAGGSSISAIDDKIRDLRVERERRSKDKLRAQTHCTALGWALAEEPATFAEMLGNAQAVIDDARNRETTIGQRRDELAVLMRDQEVEFTNLRAEIASLEESSSNIPRDLQRLRREMCIALNLPEAQVAFVGELLQVRKEYYTQWAPAAERLLGGFGRDLIIDARHHKRVAQWVDQTNLRNRLVYHPVTSGQSGAAREPKTSESIVHKLEQKPHAFSGWLHRELIERFDYECVTSAAELTKGDYRITAEGQIRHGRGRTEKDDRRDLRDKRYWVLGFDSREKLELHRAMALELVDAMTSTREETQEIETGRQQDHARVSAAQRLLDYEWKDIDVTTVAGRIAELEAHLVSLKTGNQTLAHLDGLLAAARVVQQQLLEQQSDLRNTITTTTNFISTQQALLDRARVESTVLRASQKDVLLTRVPEAWSPTLQNLSEGIGKVVSGLHAENNRLVQDRAKLEQTVTAAFAEFLRQWPEETASLQANLESAPDFFARLSRIEIDGLPEHEIRFRNLLSQQSTHRLAELSRHLSEARREIAVRLDDVNEALLTVPYNPDSYLKINPIDLHPPEAVEFRQRLALIFANQHRQTSSDLVEAEDQFQALRQLVIDLKADDAEKRRWRERVLDVRLHVEFNAEELERRTDRQIELYSGSSGKSGGQRQKLTATCLAAALRYKLGGVDGGVPQYAAVVLDEAFTKTDSDFTKTCMQIFKELGFQMIVATPIKSVMTLEEFVGGAVFVSISNRHTSSLLAIEYDQAERRLILSDKQRRQAEQEANEDTRAST
jgi:uncharacterized protein YPO0396